jgi:hypothetical protein
MANRAILYRCQNQGCQQQTSSTGENVGGWFELKLIESPAKPATRVCLITPLIIPGVWSDLQNAAANLPTPVESLDLCGPACLTAAMNRVLTPGYKPKI